MSAWRWLNSLISICIIIIISVAGPTSGRKHHLTLYDEPRHLFPVSTFGYFPGGTLNVTVAGFGFRTPAEEFISNRVGFTLTNKRNHKYSPSFDKLECLLDKRFEDFGRDVGVIKMKMDFQSLRVNLECNEKMSDIYLQSTTPTRAPEPVEEAPAKSALPEESSAKAEPKETKPVAKPLPNDDEPKVAPEPENEPPGGTIKSTVKKEKPDSVPQIERRTRDIAVEEATRKTCRQEYLPMEAKKLSGETIYRFQFKMTVGEHFGDLYQLYFHNCLETPADSNRKPGWNAIDLDLYIEEKNIDNYLSAVEMPLPQMYFIFSVIFFLLGIIWFYSLQSKQSETFKIHYLMGVVVFVKSIALFFHAINFHFIAVEGTQVEAWAILYYITHLMKGALLFFTIVLIGTGWHFVKHILTEKDKNIFMFVISLQVIANVLNIVLEESEEGTVFYMFGKQIFVIVDLICCAAIMFPIIASIQHLHQASRTDGKAAMNLKKMQLFRRYYIFVVVYIYFSRMIVYLVTFVVPYNYQWIEEFLQQLAILVFFLSTGYSFQPTGSNPYHSLLQEEYEMDEEVLFIQPSTFTEAKKLHRELESSSDKNTLINLSYDFD